MIGTPLSRKAEFRVHICLTASKIVWQVVTLKLENARQFASRQESLFLSKCVLDILKQPAKMREKARTGLRTSRQGCFWRSKYTVDKKHFL